MTKLNGAIAAAAMLAAVATATDVNTQQQQQQLERGRELYNNDGGWSSNVWAGSSSGKSGKSGSGSSGSWSGSSSHDAWGSSSGGWYSNSSGKSGKSGSGSSSGSWSDSSSHDSWSSSSWSSSGKSGKSGSSSGGGWWSNSSKSGKSKSSKGGGGWSSSSSSWSSSGKSGKSGSGGGWSNSSSWSSSGKSGKSGSGGGGSEAWSSSGKSGKSGSGGGWYAWGDSKSGKSKSGKSKSSKGKWAWVPPAPPKPDPPKPAPEPKPTRKPTNKPVAAPTKKPTKKPVAPPAPKPVPVPKPKPSLSTLCFKKGEKIPCSGSPSGDGIVSSFLYTVETKPGYSVEQVMIPLENAILSDVASNVGSGFTGSISAKPSDEINGAKECPHEDKADCAYVYGAMTFYNDDHSGSGYSGGAYALAGASDGSGSAGNGYTLPGASGSGSGYGSGSGSSQSDSYSAVSALNAHPVMGSDGGSELDACGGATLIQDAMQGNDYSSVTGVKNVKFKEKKGCAAIVASKAAVADDDEGDNTAVLVGVPLAAALLVALALLLARRMRNQKEYDLATGLDDFMGPPEDQYASTIDVHKCTSIYCNCNKGLENVSFIPAPRKVDLGATRAAAGLPPANPDTDEGEWYPEAKARDADSDTVTGVHNGSTYGELPVPKPSVPEMTTSDSDESRSYLPVEQRPLTTLTEVAHDSEIDTELESVEGGDDATSIPPPPPQSPDDEMSI
eukprot:scaffold3622_cov144-Skeletonema_menzelii.AAC.4